MTALLPTWVGQAKTQKTMSGTAGGEKLLTPSVFFWNVWQLVLYLFKHSIILVKAGLRDAPPTRKPSMSGLDISESQFSGDALPPY